MLKKFKQAYMDSLHKDEEMQKDRSKRALRRQNKKRFDKEDRYD